MLILAVVWAVTSYGVPTLLAWAWQRTRAQLGLLLSVLARALPLLLLFTTFLFINAECWQVAGTLTGAVFVAVLGVFFVLGATFVLTRIPPLMRSLARFGSWEEVTDLATDTPAAACSPSSPDDRGGASAPIARPCASGSTSACSPSSRRRSRSRSSGSASPPSSSLFGFLAIPETTAAAWTTLEQVHVLADWDVGGRTLVVTDPLLRVAGFLGAFGAMYFTVLLSTDAVYREEFADDVAPQLRQALAVRCVYRAARADRR